MKKSFILKFENYAFALATVMSIGLRPAFAGLTTGNTRRADVFITDTSDFVGDGKTDNTQAIQAAIDSCYNAGGGTVELTNGTFLTGPITLESNVTLRIDSSATLLGTTYTKAYYPANYDTSNNTLPSKLNPLITSDDASNITITGGGTINGNGQPWWTAYKSGTISVRPRLIQLNHSQHIEIDSVTLENSPQFHVSLEYCWYVTVKYVTILAPANSPNTDGIDPATCHFVYISHCRIDNGDDDIAVKSGNSDPSDTVAGSTNIWISDCTFMHGHGVSIGSETGGGVDSMYVDSCSFDSTDNGLRIKSYRGNGGNLRNIVYSNITMQNVANPIWISCYYPSIPSETDPPQAITSRTPYYHDVSIINLKSTNSPTAGVIVGLPEEPLTHIVLKNVSISATTGLEIRNATVDTANTVVTATYGPGLILQTQSVVTDVKPPEEGSIPETFQLEQNYPNPFNPTTVIAYSIPALSRVTLRVYDVLGSVVATLVNRNEPAGRYSVQFDGSRFASGVYFYRLNAGGFTETKKLMLIK